MKIASYNIMSGGFDSYTYKGKLPTRINLLKKTVREIGADFIGLVDTFRWKEVYTKEDLAEMFGYINSYHINMDDVRVDKNIGIAVLTNLDVTKFEKLRLTTRNCIRARIKVHEKPIDIFTAYLDDLSEDTRIEQATTLLSNVDENVATIVMGDINAVTPFDVPNLKKKFNSFIRNHPEFKKREDYNTYHKKVIRDLARAKVIPLIEKSGFTEVYNKSNPQNTAYTKLHGENAPVKMARVDHIFYKGNLKPVEFEVLKGGIYEKASDHYPVVAKFLNH